MTIIYIKEGFPDEHSVVLTPDGVLDGESIPVLRSVCERHMREEKEIRLDLSVLLHINREAREFLRELEKQGVLLELRYKDLSEFPGSKG